MRYGRSVLSTAMNGKDVVRIVLATEPCAQVRLQNAKLTLPEQPESYAILAENGRPLIVGRDPVGGMYGALELAELIEIDPQAALQITKVATPRARIRGANLILVLPDEEEQQANWWFYDLDFWSRFLDLMASSRLNFLDLHGMYNLENTQFPNALLRFATSPSFPGVGAPLPERQRNLETLRKVVEMADNRGIKAALTTYSSSASLNGNDPSMLSNAELASYTQEATRDLITKIPKLWGLGFRIGESGRDSPWFTRYFIGGLRAGSQSAHVVVRTWLSNKQEILDIARAAGQGAMVESKFNGEQLGPAYAVTGGLMAKGASSLFDWSVYSYESYLDLPVDYDFVFQIRSAGTHRLFRYNSFERTRKVMQTVLLGRSKGFTLEAPHAYFSQRDRFHSASDRFSPWLFERDELAYFLFGRLGYDPDTPEEVFRFHIARRLKINALWESMQAASEIVPSYITAFTCGPDHRHFAPDLEWGGSVAYWANDPTTPQNSGDTCATHYHGPFDQFAVASPFEVAEDLAAGRVTSKETPFEIGKQLLDKAQIARRATEYVHAVDPETRDVARECVALADLGEYVGHKLRGAEALAIYKTTERRDYLDAARSETGQADLAWQRLASDTNYIAPFKENLRMLQLGFKRFHWSLFMPQLAQDPASIDAVEKAVNENPAKPLNQNIPSAITLLSNPKGMARPRLVSLTISPQSATAAKYAVKLEIADPIPPGGSVRIWWKSFSGAANWASVPAVADGKVFEAEVPGTGVGVMVAAEVTLGGISGFRYPDPQKETPYLVIAP